MIPRELFVRAGGFDEAFAPAYCEDSDLCLRVRALGYETVCHPLSIGIHDESGSKSPNSDWNKDALILRNRSLLATRWSGELALSAVLPSAAMRPIDLGTTGRCLFIDMETPRVDEDAGSYAALQEMLAIRSLGMKVTCATLTLAHAGVHTERLQGAGIECVYAPYAASLVDYLARHGAEFDVVYAVRYGLLERVLDDLRRFAPRARIVFNCADVHAIRELRAARLHERLGQHGAGRDLRNAQTTLARETAVMARSDVVVVYNDDEADFVARHVPCVPVVVMPWSVATAQDPPGWSTRSGIAFLGSAKHPPNFDGIDFFIREVWGAVRDRCPTAAFHIYGAGLERHARRKVWEETPGVVVVGYVPDVGDALRRHRVFVAPLRYGSGIKGKAVMALAQGLPSVLTSVAAEGLGIRPGHEAEVVDDPTAFASRVVELYSDQKRWHSVSAAALSHSVQAFSANRVRDAMRVALFEADAPKSG
jgi:glycosyltransferase involved in cell wall biosynthesis